MIFWLVCRNCVYGCVVTMCLSGGFWSEAICSKAVVGCKLGIRSQ